MTENSSMAFVKIKPINELEEVNTLKPGWLMFDDGAGVIKKMNTENFYQILRRVALPLSPNEAAPTTVGWYKPRIYSASPGTNYPNAGNLKAIEGNDTLFYFDGKSWVDISNPMPSIDLDVKGGAMSYDSSSVLLGGFKGWDFDKPKKTVIIPASATLKGGRFLRNNNTLSTNTQYPEVGVIHNFPVGSAARLRVEGMTGLNQDPFAAIAGLKKDGTNAVIMPSTSSNVSELQTFDVTDFQAVSFQIIEGKTFPKLELIEYAPAYIDVKKYIESRLSVLDSFVNPKRPVLMTEISMPQTGEKPNAMLASGWKQYAANGYANGAIAFKDLPEDSEFISVTGDFVIGGSGIVWIGVFNDATKMYDTLVQGIQNKSELVIPIDRKKYQGFVYSRVVGNHIFQTGKYVQELPQKDSVKLAIESSRGESVAQSNSIDAYSKWGVSPTKTAAENTTALNNAVFDAFTNKKKLILPGGTIEHNGFIYKEGVDIEGAGDFSTVLLSKSATSGIRDLDSDNQNRFKRGSISRLTLDGNNIGTIGVELHNNQGFILSHVFIKNFAKAGKLVGQLAHSMSHVIIMSCKDGFEILTADKTYYGYMQSNLIHYVDVYCTLIDGSCFRIDRGSNIKFTSCNFEACGTSGNVNTGGVIATRMSPAGEGIDLTFENCWTEGLRSVFLNISNSKGTTTVRDTMVHKGGNGEAVNDGPGIINNGSRLLITGSTKSSGFDTGILTQNRGETRLDGFATFTHAEQSGGVFKQVTFS